MGQKRRRQQEQAQWEAALLVAYEEYRWRQVLEPLAEQLQRWCAGELSHADIDAAIHATHRETRHLYSFFGQSRRWLVTLIQADRDWFDAWVATHPPPPGVMGDPAADAAPPDRGEGAPEEDGT